MITKKQKRRTIILVIILAIAIVAAVFGVSYYMNGYKAPWVKQETPVVEEEPAAKPTVEEDVTEETTTETKESSETLEDTEKTESSTETEEIAKTDATSLSIDPLTKDYGYFGPLSVTDSTLTDASGNPVQLIGVSSHGINWFPEFVSAESISYLKQATGINVIRLAMYTSDYNGYCVGGESNQEALKNTIDEAINAATENQMYVILDWHILNDGNPNEYKSEAIQFFGEMVRKYKDNENIIYEICNEPNGDTSWEDIKTYANEVIPVIRNVDRDAVILVGTPSWCQNIEDVIESPLDFENIMYTYHFYAASHKAKYRNQLIDAIDNNIPVFISEFGLCSADGTGEIDEKEAENWFDLIDEYGLSACVWSFSNKDEAASLIKADYTSTIDWSYDDLSSEGQFIYDYLKELEQNDN